ncbi:D-alanyl-D-alanine carboxypeptidase family protein [Clostridium oceanicum]|uniref:serine-type D-Ala-D-Ala carboxypeptidase n=1 Tax=Clostridium oceanicum TaxID=1543 RepID=A0ABP3UX30_9CLOT
MKKNNIIIFLIISLVINCIVPFKVMGKTNDYISSYVKTEKQPIYIDAKNAIAIDANTGAVLYEKNSNELVPIASTTKIITTLVTLKYGNLDKEVKISENAAKIKGSTVGYKKGEIVTLRELLFGLMLRSGNDAAIAIAEGVAGSVDEFAKLMNEYSAEIGLLNSHFQTPHGLDKDQHYSTAYDLARATAIAKQNKWFNKIVGTKDIDKGEYNFTRSYHNINKILWKIPGANGVKTGYTGKAGKCLVTSSKFKESEVIIVVLNCTPRWKETEKIYKYLEKNYDFKKVCSKNQVLGESIFEEGTVKIVADKDVIVPFKKGGNYSVKVFKPKSLKWKVEKGDKFGTLCVFENDKLIYKLELKAGNSLNKNNIKKWFFDMSKSS